MKNEMLSLVLSSGVVALLTLARSNAVHAESFRPNETPTFCQSHLEESGDLQHFLSGLEKVLAVAGSARDQWVSEIQRLLDRNLPEEFIPVQGMGLSDALAIHSLAAWYKRARSNEEGLRAALTEIIDSQESNSVERRRREGKTRSSLVPMRFHELNLGGRNIELMETTVTRAQWQVVMDGPLLTGDRAEQHDMPVGHFLIEHVQEFLDRMNTTVVQERLVNMNLLNGDVKQGVVYRLPDEYEIEQLISLLKQEHPLALGGSSPHFNLPELERFGWIKPNQDGKPDLPYPVGLLEPVLLNGHRFFDLWGNTTELFDLWPGEDLYASTRKIGQWSSCTWTTPRYHAPEGACFAAVLAPRAKEYERPSWFLSFRLVREAVADYRQRVDSH